MSTLPSVSLNIVPRTLSGEREILLVKLLCLYAQNSKSIYKYKHFDLLKMVFLSQVLQHSYLERIQLLAHIQGYDYKDLLAISKSYLAFLGEGSGVGFHMGQTFL